MHKDGRITRSRAIRALPKHLRPRWETPDPPGVTGSYGPEVRRWAAAELGLVMGPWQTYVLDKMLRHDRSGDLVHRTAMFSTGRQNGKSVIVRAFYGWLLDVGRLVGPFREWHDIRSAAHDAKQARIIYKAVYQDLERIPRLTEKPPRTYGERADWPPVRLSRQIGIETEGLFFDIITSEPGAARGLSIGALAFDEVLTQRDFDMWDAVKPTQGSQRSPLLMLTSTAGMSDSLVLRQYHDRLRRQATGDELPDPSFFGAWWESEATDIGYTASGDRRPLTRADWIDIGRANPALGDGRLGRASIEDEHRMFPVESWTRERLNHFVDVVADSAIPPGAWASNRVHAPMAGLTGPYALGIDVDPGWSRATIAVAGLRDDGRIAVEVYRDLRRSDGERITAARLVAEVEAFPDMDHVLSISYEQVSGAAAAFVRHADETGLPWEPLKLGQMVTACMDVAERIQAGDLAVDDPLLDAQMANVARRPVGMDGAFRFSRHASRGPIDAVMAMILATHAVSVMATGPLIG